MASGGDRPLAVVILAAGRGKRFPGVPSKVLVPLAGRPLVRWVLDTIDALHPARRVVVVGHGRAAVEAVVRGPGVETVDQGEPRGTGHALGCAAPLLAGQACDLLVVNGDVPLLGVATLETMLARQRRSGAAATLLSAVVDDAAAYGRVLRRPDGTVAAIVEAADATAEELEVREINVGAYVFRAPGVFTVLAGLDDRNAQGEIYLTDAVRALVRAGERVEAVVLENPGEGLGVNTPDELGVLEARLVRR